MKHSKDVCSGTDSNHAGKKSKFKTEKVFRMTVAAVSVCAVVVTSVLAFSAFSSNTTVKPERTENKKMFDSISADVGVGRTDDDLHNARLIVESNTEAETAASERQTTASVVSSLDIVKNESDTKTTDAMAPEKESATSEVPATTVQEVTPIFAPDDDDYPYYGTYDEYCEGMKTLDIPGNFVRYEDIAFLGDFDCLCFNSDAKHGDFRFYIYSIYPKELPTINNSNSLCFSVATRDWPEKSEKFIAEKNINTADMRFLKTSDTGVFYVDGFKYNYFKGKLTSIVWESNGTRYSLGQNESGVWASLNLTENSFISDILNLEKAQTRLNYFKALTTR